MDAPSTSPSVADTRVPDVSRSSTLIILGSLVAATWLLSRGLAESLPGNLVGYDSTIGWVVYIGAFLSQFLCVCGATVAIRIAADLVAQPSSGWLIPTTALLGAGSQATYALFSSQPHDPGPNAYWQTALAILPCAALTSASIIALKRRASRGMALLCLGIMLAVWTLLVAQVLAHIASDDANGTLFFSAQSLASTSLLLRVAVALSIYAWWLLRGSYLIKVVAGIVVLFASALWIGENADGVAPVVLFTLQQLGSDPAPLVSDTPEALLELLIFSAALLPLFANVSPLNLKAATPESSRSIQLAGRAAVALGLLGSVIPDQPLGGLVLTLAALALLQPSLLPASGSLHAQS